MMFKSKFLGSVLNFQHLRFFISKMCVHTNVRKGPIAKADAILQKDCQIEIDGFSINYRKVGDGPCVVFCFPGILGSMKCHLSPQIADFNTKKEFTFITWDQPGYGHTRHPERALSDDCLSEDTELSIKFMNALGFHKYAMMGWSGGGNSALLAAIRYPDIVTKLVVWGAFSYVDKKDADNFKWFANTDNWEGKMKEALLEVYDPPFFEKHFSWWMNSFCRIHTNHSSDFCSSRLNEIQCPTLVLHGTKDGLIDLKHGQFLKERIKNSTYVEWDRGKHNLHLRYPEKFNRIVQNFLLNEKI